MKHNYPHQHDSDSKYSSDMQVSDGGRKHATYTRRKKEQQELDKCIFVANAGELGNWVEGVEQSDYNDSSSENRSHSSVSQDCQKPRD